MVGGGGSVGCGWMILEDVETSAEMASRRVARPVCPSSAAREGKGVRVDTTLHFIKALEPPSGLRNTKRSKDCRRNLAFLQGKNALDCTTVHDLIILTPLNCRRCWC